MSVWKYDGSRRFYDGPAPILQPSIELGRLGIHLNNIVTSSFVSDCPFCCSPLKDIHDEKNALYRHSVNGTTSESYFRIAICLSCGWHGSTKLGWTDCSGMVFSQIEAASSSLRDLDISDINAPVEEVRSYLLAKYEQRFAVHPRVFEEVVGSVFRGLGYEVLVTGYSNDGGIDIILNDATTQIGVQVKRYRNVIQVEQIRALVGAMVLHGINKGIFVTTSRFTRGAPEVALQAMLSGFPVELVNSTDFYSALNLTKAVLDDKRIEGIVTRLKSDRQVVFVRRCPTIGSEDFGAVYGGIGIDPFFEEETKTIFDTPGSELTLSKMGWSDSDTNFGSA